MRLYINEILVIIIIEENSLKVAHPRFPRENSGVINNRKKTNYFMSRNDKKISGNAGVGEATKEFQKLGASSNEFSINFANFDDADTIMSFVEKEWKKCNENNTIMEPLYPVGIVKEICFLIVSSWIRMELYFERDMKDGRPNSSGGNILITGTKGVGKTTLMRGLCTIIKNHSVHVRPIYLNFEEDESYSSLSTLLSFEGPFTTDSYTQWTIVNKKSILLFGDEFDFLYQKLNRPDAIKIAKEILSLGKSSTGFGVISGSSAAFRAFAYKLDPNDTRHDGYPNLNHTVYVEMRLMPIRDYAQLESVVRINGLTHLISETNINRIFSLTGGVGRRVDTIRSEQDIMRMMNYFSGAGNAIPNILTFESDTTYGCLIRQLYVKNMNWSIDSAFVLQGIPIRQLDALITTSSQQSAARVVEYLLDSHILHLNTSTNLYEFLYPQYIQCLAKYYRDTLSRLELLALETTVRGWGGFGSAGQVLEPFILRTLVGRHVEPFSAMQLAFSDVDLHVSESFTTTTTTTTATTTTTTSNHAPLAIGDLALDKVMAISPDKGLDSVYFTKPDATGDIIEVHVSQIKCGEMGKSIAHGTIGSTDASKYFTAILKNAAVGWDKLYTFLSNSYPDEVTFTLKSFALITNKTVVDSVTTLLQVPLGGRGGGALVDFIVFQKEDFSNVFEESLNGHYFHFHFFVDFTFVSY
jgi:hypothetical protein